MTNDQFDRWLADLREGRLDLPEVERALRSGLLAQINAIWGLRHYIHDRAQLIERLRAIAAAPEHWEWYDFLGCVAQQAIVELVRTGDPAAIEEARRLVTGRPLWEQKNVESRLKEEQLPPLKAWA
jgi:hypothetical protein